MFNKLCIGYVVNIWHRFDTFRRFTTFLVARLNIALDGLLPACSPGFDEGRGILESWIVLIDGLPSLCVFGDG